MSADNDRDEVPESKPIVQEGIVERVTGAGKLVVEPSGTHPDLKVGDEVMIVTTDRKPQQEITLEVLKARVTAPFPSDWTIIVRGRRALDRCNVHIDATQLRALDSDGVPKSELTLPLEGVLNFRIPENINVTSESIVEVKDGDLSVRREKFGLIGVTTIESPVVTAGNAVAVSGKISPMFKADVNPSSVEFTNTATGRKFSAAITNGRYSVELPNHESYRATVTWVMPPSRQSGVTEAGFLSLNESSQTYNFDVNW